MSRKAIKANDVNDSTTDIQLDDVAADSPSNIPAISYYRVKAEL